jgi:hypothetical protein
MFTDKHCIIIAPYVHMATALERLHFNYKQFCSCRQSGAAAEQATLYGSIPALTHYKSGNFVEKLIY